MNKAPGLYGEKDNLIFSWQELLDKGLNIKEEYRVPNTPGTLYFLLKDNNLANVKLKIVLPEGITSFGKNSISGCDGVTSVELPSTLEAINAKMFWYYRNLESICIPNKVKSIDHHAFSYCESLINIKFSDSLELIDTFAFSSCSMLEQIRIPESVKSVEPYAFEYCEKLKSVEILNPDVEIYKNTFAECRNLEKIFIYKKVSKNNPNFAKAYEDKIKYFEDISLDELLDKGYTLTESNRVLNSFQIEER